MNRTVPLLLAALGAAGCGGDAGDDAPPVPPVSAAEADADRLGREVLRLLDQLAEYRGAHRGRLPATLRQLGVDSLTPEIARAFRRSGDSVVATVSFRRLDGHELEGCSGGLELLEAAVLADGRYPLTCRTTAGAIREIVAGSE
ncbi:MAG TPA: hypothetical protein VF037_00035 [Gemmatimonadales bacterium]